MLSHNRKLYRIVRPSVFEKMFENKQNALVRPSVWADPMENLLKYGFRDSEGADGEFLFRDRYYAQCWSLESRSDAAWQVYSDRIDSPIPIRGIRLRTTVAQLKKSLQDKVPNIAGSILIRKIKYLNDQELNKFCLTQLNGRLSHNKVMETFCVKRQPFSWEKEVRLVYFNAIRSQNGDLFHYGWDPNKIIDQIMVDPLCTMEDFKDFKFKLRKMGFEGEIKLSKLYAPPSKLKFHL